MIGWFGTLVHAQEVLEWEDLTNGIFWESKMDFAIFREASFSNKITSLEGKEVIVMGFFLSLDGNPSTYLLSKNPMASCFFCGNGGPETIIELQFIKKPSYLTDDLLSVSGILRLNRNNPNHCYYRIEKAEALSL
ncbi:MAG: hypothetical protein ABJN84_07995 [Flavobacteriaceae bacterium]